jgi:uncharacterized membrane protein
MNMRWLSCFLPPIAVIWVEETPGLSGLEGINAAALLVMSPIFLALGFAMTIAIVTASRWLFQRFDLKSRIGFILFTLMTVGILSPITYLDRDWLLLGVIELASLPAAFFFAPVIKFTNPLLSAHS